MREDPGFTQPEIYLIGEGRFKKKNTKLKYKIRYRALVGPMQVRVIRFIVNMHLDE